MSKKQLMCLLGVWVIIFPFLGVPTLWFRIIGVVTGIVIVTLAYMFPSQLSSGANETFVENKHE